VALTQTHPTLPRKSDGEATFGGLLSGTGDGFCPTLDPYLRVVSLGLTPRQQDMFATTTSFCEPLVAPDSIYGLLHRECHRLFPDEMFQDLFCDVGRRCVPPMIVAVVMVLQRIEGCSDREAVERFTFDARWKYAAGGLQFDYPGFVHTVLVDMRARLVASEDPERIFNVTLDVGKRAGLVGRRRVLDSTPIYDAVATMDTVTLVRSAICGLLAACDGELESRLRDVLSRDDEYRSAGKPVCDYDDPAARQELVDALAKDALALLVALEGIPLGEEVAKAATLLASVVGQDLEVGEDGVFWIARRVAKDRIISTVDPDARHGRKTSARGFDGYKGHVAVDPDSELILATTVTAGNAGDAAAAADELLADDLAAADEQSNAQQAAAEEVEQPAAAAADPRADTERERREERLSVYGDSAYGSGELLAKLERADAASTARCSRRSLPAGASPRTRSRSICGRARSPVRPGTRSRSGGRARGRSPASARPAVVARWPRSAPAPRTSARSRSGLTRPSSPAPASGKPTRPGRPTTRPPARRSSARSRT
jgi:ketosteroid isomerase-like protein